MKGVIFNLLEDFIIEGWGDDVYDEILSRCSLRTTEPFIGPGTYDDADLLAIVAQAAETLGLTVPEAVRAFGRYCFSGLARKFPVFLEGHRELKTFLKSIDEVIHVELKKLVPEAEPPKITFVDPAPNELILTYRSRRRLCPLMAGLLEGAAAYFGTPLEYRETKCTSQGADACEFHLTFPAMESTAA
jgi:predicted hydrocarbon binding protein